jgi:hypothetical protein
MELSSCLTENSVSVTKASRLNSAIYCESHDQNAELTESLLSCVASNGRVMIAKDLEESD